MSKIILMLIALAFNTIDYKSYKEATNYYVIEINEKSPLSDKKYLLEDKYVNYRCAYIKKACKDVKYFISPISILLKKKNVIREVLAYEIKIEPYDENYDKICVAVTTTNDYFFTNLDGEEKKESKIILGVNEICP